jgi:hypothetical protein
MDPQPAAREAQLPSDTNARWRAELDVVQRGRAELRTLDHDKQATSSSASAERFVAEAGSYGGVRPAVNIAPEQSERKSCATSG